MTQKIALFWPGDYRDVPNQVALPNIEEATAQLEQALKKLGRESYRIEGFLARPHESIEKLGPIDDPMIGVCVHWFYGPHTTDGVVGKDNPLLLASNFSGTWPGLVGLLNTGACLESSGAALLAGLDRRRRLDRGRGLHGAPRGVVHHRPHRLPRGRDRVPGARSRQRRRASRVSVADEIRAPPRPVPDARRHLDGDDQRLLRAAAAEPASASPSTRSIRPGSSTGAEDIDPKPHRRRFPFVCDKGVTFHCGEEGAEDFTAKPPRSSCATTWRCWTWSTSSRPTASAGSTSSGCFRCGRRRTSPRGCSTPPAGPSRNGDTIVCATEADQGNLVPMEMMKRLLKEKGLHQAVMFHDVRWGGEHEGRFVWVLLNSGSCGAYAFNHDPDTLQGVHSYRQPRTYFPVPGGTFAGESLPGEITWARAYIRRTASSGWTSAAARSWSCRRRSATPGGTARPASGRSWRPTWASRATP